MQVPHHLAGQHFHPLADQTTMNVLGGHLGPTVLAARRQLACPLPASYLHAITAPMTFSQAITNIVRAPSWTSFEIERFPTAATPCPD